MPKRKKYPKLPNGFGSIKYLGKGRRNPYAVHPPTSEFALNGSPITPKAICYTDAWIKGFTVLTALKAGTYYKGMELELNLEDGDAGSLETLAQKILADYSASRPLQAQVDDKVPGKTFQQVYDDFFAWKFERNKKREYSRSTIDSTRAAYKNCAALYDRVFADLRYPDLQNVVDSCELKHSSLELIVTLFHQLYKYALAYEIVDKDYSAIVRINIPDDDEHGEPFTDSELKILWKNKTDPIVEMIIIMCYSGYRIEAYHTLEVDLYKRYFKGGVKTRASKDRIVPIHSAILPLVQHRLKQYKILLPCTNGSFRTDMYSTLERLKLPRHTPHDCRHTFSKLCEEAKVNENDRRRLLGHSFGADITNGIYGHRSLEDLRTEIEKIKVE